ncbi:MAG: response regulator transcription factor [Burkholderiales bacterium]|nr:response regulator transcription factor [Burkholderiales bacterium]
MVSRTPMEPTVFVVDDDSSTRELLAWLMHRNGLKAQVFPDARSFLALYKADMPGCLVVDLNMPGMNGLDLQQYLKENGVLLPVIFLSGRADVAKAVRAVREGAIDFIEKPFDYRRVLALVDECLRRDAEAREKHERRRTNAARIAQLTQREREVMELVVAGRMNREIAEKLDISIKTVEAHRAKIMEKLEVDSVAELVQATLAAG